MQVGKFLRVFEVTNFRQLNAFLKVPQAIYRGDQLYVPYMKADLKRTLKKLLFEEKSYTALLAEDGGKPVARVLFTVAPSKQLGLDRCGFFSHFECIDNRDCANLLLGKMFEILKGRGVSYVEGTYFPYDQDNRRGILVDGFLQEPMILTSYNPAYYGSLLESVGFHKDFDTVSYALDYSRYDVKRIAPLVEKVLSRYDLYIAEADFSNLDREIEDVHKVISMATTDIIFQDAPTCEDLHRIVGGWKSFLWRDFIHICRRRSDNEPVGFMMSIPNFYTVFRKMKGRSGPVALLKALYYRRKITSVRAILQYVIPEYQSKGVNFALYHAFYTACKKRGILKMEGGTIMEHNDISRKNVEKASGVVNKVFRIYGREL